MAATITFACTRPGGAPAAGEKIRIEHLTGANTPGYTGTSEIIGVYEFRLANDGTYSIDLDPCEGDMEGSVYEITGAGLPVRIQPITDGTWSWADPAIQTLDAPAIQYVQGPPGGTFLGGTLAARPAAGPTAVNTGYHAEDDNGGTFYRRTASATWAQAAPSVADVGGTVLASCWPSSIAALGPYTGGAVLPIPELTTASFECPDRPVRVHLARLLVNTSASTAATPEIRLQVRVNAGSWSTFGVVPTITSGSGTSFRFPTDIANLYPGPIATALSIDPGDDLEVRATYVAPTSVTTVTPVVLGAFSAWAGFDVIAL